MLWMLSLVELTREPLLPAPVCSLNARFNGCDGSNSSKGIAALALTLRGSLTDRRELLSIASTSFGAVHDLHA